MATLATLPRAVYPANTYTLPSTVIPQGVARLGISVFRFAWPDIGGDVVRAALELSFDNGATWGSGFAFTAAGGPATYKGVDAPLSGMTVPVDQPTSTTRRVRGVVTVFAALDASVLIESL